MDKLLQRYNELLVEKNLVLNLTAHKDLQTSWKYNVLDSVLFNDVVSDIIEEVGAKCLDIGSGGGSPAIPLKISFPQLNMIMLDSVGKKVNFLNEVVGGLGLDNIRGIHARIEDFDVRDFDLVTARAVAPMCTLVEYALPFLRVGGVMIAFKGKNVDEEINQARRAIEILGGQVLGVEGRSLDEETVRHLVIIKKIKVTPKGYPRGKNLPRLRPL